ncbi:MAG: hypothetical protein JW827_02990 [Spirochaetes bacterium]|nr:hypothetical protein [Spirochaetota bacterium]
MLHNLDKNTKWGGNLIANFFMQLNLYDKKHKKVQWNKMIMAFLKRAFIPITDALILIVLGKIFVRFFNFTIIGISIIFMLYLGSLILLVYFVYRIRKLIEKIPSNYLRIRKMYRYLKDFDNIIKYESHLAEESNVVADLFHDLKKANKTLIDKIESVFYKTHQQYKRQFLLIFKSVLYTLFTFILVIFLSLRFYGVKNIVFNLFQSTDIKIQEGIHNVSLDTGKSYTSYDLNLRLKSPFPHEKMSVFSDDNRLITNIIVYSGTTNIRIRQNIENIFRPIYDYHVLFSNSGRKLKYTLHIQKEDFRKLIKTRNQYFSGNSQYPRVLLLTSAGNHSVAHELKKRIVTHLGDCVKEDKVNNNIIDPAYLFHHISYIYYNEDYEVTVLKLKNLIFKDTDKRNLFLNSFSYYRYHFKSRQTDKRFRVINQYLSRYDIIIVIQNDFH